MVFKADVTINDCTFELNSAQFGGAISAQNDTTRLSVNNCLFNSNSVTGNGAAVNVNGGITSSFDNCTFQLNNSEDVGGALAVTGEATLPDESQVSISNSTFNFNTAINQAGAINIFNVNADISNSVIVNNTVSADGTAGGGGISINVGDTASIDVNLINSTLAFNTAPIGAGVLNLRVSMNHSPNLPYKIIYLSISEPITRLKMEHQPWFLMVEMYQGMILLN